MEQVTELEYLKAAKREARFLVNFYNNVYKEKLTLSPVSKREVLYEALRTNDKQLNKSIT